jgi:tRNA A-37 threonylcarbamoyl transferase component Bud32
MAHFVENYQQYLVMEYIEGEHLAEKLAKRRESMLVVTSNW